MRPATAGSPAGPRSLPGSKCRRLNTIRRRGELAGPARWDRADRVAVAAGTAAEPSPTRAAEHALLGVAEFSGQVRQADVSVAQVVFGGFAANAVDEFAEGGVLRAEAAVQCPGVQTELGGDQREAGGSGGQQLAD